MPAYFVDAELMRIAICQTSSFGDRGAELTSVCWSFVRVELLTFWLGRRRDLDLSQAFERPSGKLAGALLEHESRAIPCCERWE
jgi:hypothetical protein